MLLFFFVNIILESSFCHNDKVNDMKVSTVKLFSFLSLLVAKSRVWKLHVADFETKSVWPGKKKPKYSLSRELEECMRITCSPFCKSSSLAVYTFLFQSSRIQYSDSLIPSPPVCPPSLAQVVGDLVTFQPQELLMDFLLDLDLGSLLTYGLCAAAMAALFWLSTSLMPNTKFDHSSSRSSTKSRGRPQLPPGPTGLAGLVKFFRGLNKFELHLTATEWAKQYGEIVACNNNSAIC